LEKLQNNTSLNTSENEYVMYLADSFLLLHLNAYPDAIQCLNALKELLKNRADKKAYIKYKEVLRVLRKINSITIVGQII
jgi:hypothetical protein